MDSFSLLATIFLFAGSVFVLARSIGFTGLKAFGLVLLCFFLPFVVAYWSFFSANIPQQVQLLFDASSIIPLIVLFALSMSARKRIQRLSRQYAPR